MLYTDKYRPRTLAEFDLHQDTAQHLEKLVQSNDCPHMLFYGPSGAGKKTLVLALLRELYGPGVEKLHVECRPWKIELPSRTIEIELTTINSAHHVEMTPSDAGLQDRHVVQEVIRDMARERAAFGTGVFGSGGGGGGGAPAGKDAARLARSFKVLILDDVDGLSRDAQHSLRCTMEKYAAGCRLILLANNVSRVIAPLRSRCLCVRVGAPTEAQILLRLQSVCEAEGRPLPPPALARIAAAARRNLRRALLALESAHVTGGEGEGGAVDWEAYVREIAADVRQEQSPKRLYLVRGKLYELLVNCIPPEVIIRQLALELMPKLDDELRASVAQHAAFYEHRMQEGSKAIFHLEAFVARFMADYKNFLLHAMA